MAIKKKATIMIFCICHLLSFFYSCKEKQSDVINGIEEKYYVKDEKAAIDSLLSHNLYNYLDSALLYMYVYFGGDVIKRCGTVDIDSILPSAVNRKVIYHNLLLRHVRFVKDSSLIYLSLTPLINDSVLSCDIVEGPQLPYEILFNYKIGRFVQFVYDENNFLKINADPLLDYENNLKVVIERDKIEPHKKFKEILSSINSQ